MKWLEMLLAFALLALVALACMMLWFPAAGWVSQAYWLAGTGLICCGAQTAVSLLSAHDRREQMQKLQVFMDAACAEGLVLNGIDACALYVSIWGYDPP